MIFGDLDPDEQLILRNWYFSLKSKGTLIWSVFDDLCGQTGISCDSSSPYQRVTDIYLTDKQLSGTIPNEFGNLINLQTLYLNINQLNGTIPTQLGNLTNLQELYLSENQINGPIPTQLGNLVDLKQLVLSKNQFSGIIPTEIINLISLNFLDLSYNNLTGGVPTQIATLINLQQLDLSNNNLGGKIVAELANLINLQHLDLWQNKLKGTIPTILGNLTLLQHLDLSYNQLSATIPTELATLTGLQQLSLSNNQLNGTIPTEFEALNNLEYLDLWNNQLTETIPTELGNLNLLNNLDLSHNQFSGIIPLEFQNLINLSQLYLNSNHLTGTIPSFIMTFSLEYLYLATNYWDCPVFEYSFAQKHDYASSKDDCDSSCESNPCLNGGQCSTRLDKVYHCECLPGYNGTICESKIFCSEIPNEGNATWDETFADGSTVSGTCLSGYYGTVSRTCSQAGLSTLWGPISGSCNAVYCSSIPNEGNAEWAQTLANGQYISGSCISGYEGLISRKCVQSAWIGNWSPTNGSCDDVNECLANKGGCGVNANCINTPGSYECHCKPGYYGNGITCSPCPAKFYSFNETTCFPCPENSTSLTASPSIYSCKCSFPNHYPDDQTSTCISCSFGYLLDNTSNTCQKIKCSTLSSTGGTFQSVEINEISYSNCSLNYYVFQSLSPYSPILNEKGKAICLLNNDNITANWSIIEPCEPTCLARPGKCDNNQVCAKPIGETIEKCICAGYVGKYCETVDSQGCNTLNCLNNGNCIDKTDTTAAYCNCTGTGYEGSFCEIDINDCVENVTCLNGGTCIDYGVGKTVCVCPYGFIGTRCELCTPDTCSNNGKCIIQNGISSCNCFGTGYEGDFCEIQKDCRSKKCLNNGECRINYDNDTAKCICKDEYKGDICEMEKYSTVDQVTVYYFLGPIFVIYLLVCLGIFLQARRGDRETKKSWIFFLLRFLMSCLGIFDLLTDIFFIIQSYDYGVEENNFGFFWSSLIFTVVPWSLAAICTGIFLVAWKRKLDLSDSSHNNFMIFSFFTVVSLLSANGVETFHLVSKYLFLKEGKVIQVSDYAGYLTIYFIIKTFIEDFPQLIIQGIFQSELGKANPIVTLSLANSALSCFITAVTFPFTHEFDYLKTKVDKMVSGSGTFYQPSKEQLFQMQ